jgi:hypothetical protein
MGSFRVFITPVLLHGGKGIRESHFLAHFFLFFWGFSSVDRTGWGVGHDSLQYRRIT